MGTKKPIRQPKTGRRSATRRSTVKLFRNAKLIGGTAQILALVRVDLLRPVK